MQNSKHIQHTGPPAPSKLNIEMRVRKEMVKDTHGQTKTRAKRINIEFGGRGGAAAT